MPAGSFAGALLVSYVADRIGRKKTVILSGIIFIIGSTLQSAALVCIRLHFSRDPLSCRTGFRYVNSWPSYLRYSRGYSIDHYPALSVGNYCAVNPRSSCLDPTMVYHVGHSYPIFHTIRLLVHRRRRVFPNSMGPPSSSGCRTFHRHACLPRISSMAH